MKYAIIIPDGCADEPQESLGGKTPLQAANIPAMDAVAAAGVVGRANNTPEALPAGSDMANLSLLGYNPLEHFTGRAPLEAAAQGIELGPDDWAVRCNLVTDRRPGDEELHRRPHLLGRGGRTDQDGPGKARRRAAPVLSGRELSEPAGLSRRGPAGAVLARHPHHAAPRPDRQVGAGRLSPRAGQRSAEPPDERERAACSPTIR